MAAGGEMVLSTFPSSQIRSSHPTSSAPEPVDLRLCLHGLCSAGWGRKGLCTMGREKALSEIDVACVGGRCTFLAFVLVTETWVFNCVHLKVNLP